jgi:hypothetical protein
MSHVSESDLEFAEEMVKAAIANKDLREEFVESNQF